MTEKSLSSTGSRQLTRRAFVSITGSTVAAMALAGRASAAIPPGAHVPVLIIGTGTCAPGGIAADARPARAIAAIVEPVIETKARRVS